VTATIEAEGAEEFALLSSLAAQAAAQGAPMRTLPLRVHSVYADWHAPVPHHTLPACVQA
jgi:hypothetical protein